VTSDFNQKFAPPTKQSSKRLEINLNTTVCPSSDFCNNALYNQQLPQAVLGSKTPLQTMKYWYKLKPKLFKKILTSFRDVPHNHTTGPLTSAVKTADQKTR